MTDQATLDTLIAHLRDTVGKLTCEKLSLATRLAKAEADCQNALALIDDLRETIQLRERECIDLHHEIDDLRNQLRRLKK